MLELSETHKATNHVLDLLRCDHCKAPLHSPFTTGVCEHLVCASCRSGQNGPEAMTCCPVCRIPVHLRDFQLHPQISELVLVARRLRKLTDPSKSAISPPTNYKLESSDVTKETDLDLLSGPSQEIPNVVLKRNTRANQIGNAVHPLEPRIVLKRAYSATSSLKSLSHSVSDRQKSCSSSTIITRGHSLDAQSLASSNMTHHSTLATSEPWVTRKPRRRRLQHEQSVAIVNSSSGNCVTKLPTHHSPEDRKWCDDSSVATDHNLVAGGCSPKGVHSESMEMVLKAANRVHQTRSSLRSGRRDSAPIASPECSILTNSSITTPQDNSPGLKVKVEAPDQKPIKELSKSRQNRSAVVARSVDKNTKLKRTTSTSFLRVLKKFRPNSKGESVLHRAAIKGDLAQVNGYLQSGMSPDTRDHAGWTPLHEAVLHGHLEVVKSLLNAGATVDIPGGPDLDTPLHDAIQNAQSGCCQVLLAHGANPILPNGLGITPMQLVDNSISQIKDSSVKSKRKSSAMQKQATLTKALFTIRSDLLSAISKSLNSAELKKEAGVSDPVNESTITLEAVNSSTFLERRRSRPVLLATGLSRQQLSTFTRVATMIHARVVSAISPEVTHVITGASQEFPNVDKSGRKPHSKKSSDEISGVYQATCPRTLKFLNAVLQGCWVLSFDWIETCAHVKMRVEEEGFEVTGCSTTPHSGAPRRARLSREAGSLGLFYGLRMCFLGQFVYPVPPRDDLVTLARSGGAMIAFNRDRCSSLRLARLTLENTDSRFSSGWELIASGDVDDGDDEENGRACDDHPFIDTNSSHLAYSKSSPLLVVYDPGYSGEPRKACETPYAVNAVSEVLNMIRPRTDPAPDFPIRAIPSTWLLDCAAEYTLLPYPNA